MEWERSKEERKQKGWDAPGREGKGMATPSPNENPDYGPDTLRMSPRDIHRDSFSYR